MIGLEYFLLLISGTRFSLCDFNSFLFTKFCEIDLILFVCFYFIYVFIFLVTIHFNISVVPPAHMKIPELNHHFCVLHLSRFIYNYQLGNIFFYLLISCLVMKAPKALYIWHITLPCFFYSISMLIPQVPSTKTRGKERWSFSLLSRDQTSHLLYSPAVYSM